MVTTTALVSCGGKKKGAPHTKGSKVMNDRMVVITGASHDELKFAIQDFLNLYHSNLADLSASLTQQAPGVFVVTFPYGVRFDQFCFFVNYMRFPQQAFHTTDVKGWTTLKEGDVWAARENANKMVMIYVPKDDDEYDNVYMTTADNVGYKMGFAVNSDHKPLPKPLLSYTAPSITPDQIKGTPSEELTWE